MGGGFTFGLIITYRYQDRCGWDGHKTKDAYIKTKHKKGTRFYYKVILWLPFKWCSEPKSGSPPLLRRLVHVGRRGWKGFILVSGCPQSSKDFIVDIVRLKYLFQNLHSIFHPCESFGPHHPEIGIIRVIIRVRFIYKFIHEKWFW